MAPPKYLFRCYSDQSNGTNTPTLFAPASLSENNISAANPDWMPLDSPSLGEQLRQALLWKKDQVMCPFVFLTTSPIFAIQLAAWRSARKTSKDGTVVEPDTNVRIAVINTETAHTPTGQPAHFQSVNGLLTKHNIRLTNHSDGSLRGYEVEWAATTKVMPGEGSFHVGFQDLINNGLYELYPQIEAANDRRDPRPSLTTKDLRKYYFGKGANGPKVEESLDTAARLGLCFKANTTGHGPSETMMGALMAFVLSLRKRNTDDSTFLTWLTEHTTPEPGRLGDTSSGAGTLGSVDAEEFDTLNRLFAGLRFHVDGLSVGLSIDLASIEKEKNDWVTWWRSDRNEYREAHPLDQRPNRREKRVRQRYQLTERRQRRDSVVATPRYDTRRYEKPRYEQPRLERPRYERPR